MKNDFAHYAKILVDLHEQGDMPSWEMVLFIVKSIAQEGGQSDFDSLPVWLKAETEKEIEVYKIERDWKVIINGAIEDYAPYADKFIKKIEF
ncbi:hypothetical protein [Metapseudomonas otitidis]|uniref:hypothetical protein n=1 Tax=Metapseudomonas otitidis TaxID=319939 RepID=UPI00280B11F5|nr:hypothetical protein [Pseudomonas otitidis]